MIVEVFEQLTNVASMPKENLSSSIKKTYKPVEDWVEKLIALLVEKGWIIQRNNGKHLEINRHQRKQKIMQILKDKNKSVKLTNYQGLGDIEEEYKKYFF